MSDRVLVFDQDIRMAIFFLTNRATILEFMQKSMIKKSHDLASFDFEPYKVKMDAYEEVFDAVFEDFSNSMFGLYSNSVNKDTFQFKLRLDGWKYFDLHNLNELFSIKY